MTTNPDAFPPSNFNLSRFVFRPRVDYVPRPGLQDQIELMTREGRYRSALHVLLSVLRTAPHDQEALTLALIVLGRARTEQVQADEALGPRDLYDTALDPVFAVCSLCARASWAASSCVFSHAIPHAIATNPVGKQCWGCGYVMCRNCYQGTSNCPKCGSPDLRAPVYPTGRHSRQLQRRNAPVVCTLVLREGPIAPDGQWMSAFFDVLSPDVLEDGSHLVTWPIQPWRPDIADLAMAFAAQVSGDGKHGPLALDTMIGAEVLSHDGLRVYVVKLYADE